MRTAIILLAAFTFAIGAVATAEQVGTTKSPRVDSVTPCCAISGVNHTAGTVTVRVTATGHAFEVNFPTAMLARLRVGDALELVRPSTSPNVPQPEPATPCCAVVAIDLAAGAASIRVTKTGQTFRAPVDARTLKALKPGAQLNLIRVATK